MEVRILGQITLKAEIRWASNTCLDSVSRQACSYSHSRCQQSAPSTARKLYSGASPTSIGQAIKRSVTAFDRQWVAKLMENDKASD